MYCAVKLLILFGPLYMKVFAVLAEAALSYLTAGWLI